MDRQPPPATSDRPSKRTTTIEDVYDRKCEKWLESHWWWSKKKYDRISNILNIEKNHIMLYILEHEDAETDWYNLIRKSLKEFIAPGEYEFEDEEDKKNERRSRWKETPLEYFN